MTSTMRVPYACLMTTLLSISCLSACGFSNGADQRSSALKTVDLPQTPAKEQRISNCWIYAMTGWAESLSLRGNPNESFDYSEGYFTYRHLEDQLMAGRMPAGGGEFDIGVKLLQKYGLMRESDFLPKGFPDSGALEERAWEKLNKSLKTLKMSELKALPEPERKVRVRQLLDSAFGVNSATFDEKTIPLSRIEVGKNRAGNKVSLAQEIVRWKHVEFPKNVWSTPLPFSKYPVVLKGLSGQQREMLQKVKRALNEGSPVLIGWFVDQNAHKDGVFSSEILRRSGKPGLQGYHMSLLEDYVTHGKDPRTGRDFRTPEGELSEYEKELAAEYGEIDYMVAKNSWGAVEGATYKRGWENGYVRIDADYLFAWHDTRDPQTGKPTEHAMGIESFVFPEGD